MSKAIRIDDQLLDRASAEAALHLRTPPKQIELWAQIGQLVSSRVSAEDALAISQGLATVRVERVTGQPVSTRQVWDKLEQSRENRSLSNRLKAGRTVYQASQTHPGLLDEIRPDGSVRQGHFIKGCFKENSHG
jgi:hypothetical protein